MPVWSSAFIWPGKAIETDGCYWFLPEKQNPGAWAQVFEGNTSLLFLDGTWRLVRRNQYAFALGLEQYLVKGPRNSARTLEQFPQDSRQEADAKD